jgi:DNA mismatch repair protein MutS
MGSAVLRAEPAEVRDGSHPDPACREQDAPALSLLQDLSGSPDPGHFESDADTLRDLGLQQLVEGLTNGREAWDLRSLFLTRASSRATVEYRQAVFQDLEDEGVSTALIGFCNSMRSYRQALERVAARRHQLQQGAWFLEAAAVYCRAVAELAGQLESLDLKSSGLRRWRDYLGELTGSRGFSDLAGEAASIRGRLDQVRYLVEVVGTRVTVRGLADEADYGEELRSMFARFRQGGARSHLFQLSVPNGLSAVEERILELVARLFPEPFLALQRFWEGHDGFADPTVLAVERELQFYLSYREFIQPMALVGLQFCYPQVSADFKSEIVLGGFDLGLAARLVPQGDRVVTNDLELAGEERLLIVSGPNQGGKTTFARSFGQIHHLAGLGCPVPAGEARLMLCDQLLTHFERQERLEDPRGRLEDDLERVGQILGRATARSVVILNETFGSASLQDGRKLGQAVVERLIDRGVIGVYVTFIEELASLGPATVSMVSQVDPSDPARRTFRVVRQPADGLAYAMALAERHGLTYSQLKRSRQC